MSKSASAILPALLLTGALAQACATGATPQGTSGPRQDAPALREELFSRHKVLLIVPAVGDLRTRASALLARYKSFGGRIDVRLAGDDEQISPAFDEVEILAGTPGANRRIAALLPVLPVALSASGFRFGGKEYTAIEARITMLAPDGPRPDRLLLLSVGNSPEAALRGIASLLFSGFEVLGSQCDYRVRGEGTLERTGRFILSGAPPWRIDPSVDHDEERERQAFYASLQEHRYPGGVVTRVPADLVLVAERWGASRARSLSRVSPEVSATFILYHDIVEKGRYTGNVLEAHRDPSRTGVIHALATDAAGGWADLEAIESELFRTGKGFAEKRPWLLAGEAVLRLERWQGRSCAEWCALFKEAGVLPGVGELLSDERGDDQSPFIFIPSAGRLGSVVRERFGEKSWSRLLRGEGGPAQLAEVDRVWRAEAARGVSLPLPPRPEARRVTRVQTGVCLAHVNDLRFGYASDDVRKTLDHLRSIGVSWISVTPFGFARAAGNGHIGFVLEGPHAETDSQMRVVIAEAHRRGIGVLYKPHLWVEGSGWAGDISMPDEAGWRRWFASYRRFAVHNALLAAECGAEGFVAGTELVKTTVREEDWRGVIAAVRRVFPGWVTYAANWYGEFDRIRFWDALDAVGIDLYEPLSASPAATDQELLDGARAAAAKIEGVARRWERPAIVTELGLPSRPAAWQAPQEEVAGAAADGAAQERGYRALFEALWGRPWLAGLYWWKYETSPRRGREENSLTPRGKPAENVIRQYYLGAAGKLSGGE